MQPLALSGNYKLAAAIVVGMMFGFILAKSDLAWPKSILESLRLRNGRIIKTFLLTLGLGAVLFFFARRAGLVHIEVRPTYVWGAILGGICCGAGLVLSQVTPVTGVINLAAGKFYVVWSFLGMALAYPMLDKVSHWMAQSIFRWSEPVSSPVSPITFMAWNNPAVYVAVIMGILLLLVHFTIGDPEE